MIVQVFFWITEKEKSFQVHGYQISTYSWILFYVEIKNIKVRVFNVIQTYISNECCKKKLKEHDGITTTLNAKELECMLLWLNELYDKLQFILKKNYTFNQYSKLCVYMKT